MSNPDQLQPCPKFLPSTHKSTFPKVSSNFDKHANPKIKSTYLHLSKFQPLVSPKYRTLEPSPNLSSLALATFTYHLRLLVHYPPLPIKIVFNHLELKTYPKTFKLYRTTSSHSYTLLCHKNKGKVF